jgi:hypothetical protein
MQQVRLIIFKFETCIERKKVNWKVHLKPIWMLILTRRIITLIYLSGKVICSI